MIVINTVCLEFIPVKMLMVKVEKYIQRMMFHLSQFPIQGFGNLLVFNLFFFHLFAPSSKKLSLA